MDEEIKVGELSAEELRELGKIYFFNSDGDREKKSRGLNMILDASNMGDAEAGFLVARLLLDGMLSCRDGSSAEERGLTLMCRSANQGCIQARGYLNSYCELRYRKKFGFLKKAPGNCLVDFDGKPIKIDRKGIFTPIDAILEHKDGTNVLTLKVNLMFLTTEELPNMDELAEAVRRGILAWQGDYEVFGGQPLTLTVELTEEERAFDNLMIMPFTSDVSSVFKAVGRLPGSKKRSDIIDSLIDHRRSFASHGLRWTVNSRKIIVVQSSDGTFTDYHEIMHAVKHEFGHSLGLGDLYYSEVDGYSGVETGTYEELDSYSITGKLYNLVMCDHHGPISNNDVEMVILAFRDNRIQGYQRNRVTRRVSSALGKGN